MSKSKLKIALIVGASLLTAVLAGCAKEAETTAAAGREFSVARLFTHEGCTVYRFSDAGNYRYFTNCRGDTSWQEGCGKGCSRNMGVSTDAR